MSSNSVCNHTGDKQIGLPLRGRPILLSLVWLQTELDDTKSYYHYKSDNNDDLSTAMMLRIAHLLKQVCIIWLLLLTSISSKRLVLEAFLLSVTFRMGIFPFPYTFVIVV